MTDIPDSLPLYPFSDAKRGRGRPPVEPPWYAAAAKMVAYGMTLRKALWRLGIRLRSERELKNIYRHVRFRHHYEKFRREFILEWGAGGSPRQALELALQLGELAGADLSGWKE